MNSSHMVALKQKHAELENRLEREESRPHPDDMLVHDLKKQKLILKDEIAREAELA